MSAPKDPEKYQLWLEKVRAGGQKGGLAAKMALSSKSQSEEHRRKNSEAHKGKISSEETRRKMSESHTGKVLGPHTPETLKKISEAKKGKSSYNKGKPMLEESKRRQLETRLAKNGGLHRDPRQSSKNFIWKEEVHTKDEQKCVLCGISREEHRLKYGRDINAHHIKEWDDFPELRFIVDNGQTLCDSCHQKFHKR